MDLLKRGSMIVAMTGVALAGCGGGGGSAGSPSGGQRGEIVGGVWSFRKSVEESGYTVDCRTDDDIRCTDYKVTFRDNGNMVLDTNTGRTIFPYYFEAGSGGSPDTLIIDSDSNWLRWLSPNEFQISSSYNFSSYTQYRR